MELPVEVHERVVLRSPVLGTIVTAACFFFSIAAEMLASTKGHDQLAGLADRYGVGLTPLSQ